MQKIILPNKTVVLVDDEDRVPLLLAGKWQEDSAHGTRTYARARIGGKRVYMHRFLLGDTGGKDIDHIDGNGLNNQRSNLRLLSRSLNNLNNHQTRIDSQSQIAGVYFCHTHLRWIAEMKYKGKRVLQRTFRFQEDAVAARAKAEALVRQGINPKTRLPFEE